MAYLLRIALGLLLSAFAGVAVADGGPFPASPGQWDTSTCSPSLFPVPNWLSPSNAPNAAPSWSCMAAAGSSRVCGYSYREDAGGQGFSASCNQQKGAESCPAGANMSTASDGSSVCTCTAGLRPSNGQCVALPACPEGQHEEGGACVPDACKPNETRVNGVCVPDPPCPSGETRVNGVCKKANCKAGSTGSYYDMTSKSSVVTCANSDGNYCTMVVEWRMTLFDDPPRYYGIGYLTGSSCAARPDGPLSPSDPEKDPDPNKPDPTKPDPNKPGSKPGDSPGSPQPGTPPGSDGKCPAGTYKSNGACYPNDPPKQPPDNDGKCSSGYVKVGSECAPLKPRPDDADGNGVDDKDEDEDKDRSSFGGQCEAVACEGDAIQCAIARDQYRRSCQLMEKESAESQLYATNKGKEGNQTGSLPGNETVSLQGRIDTSDALGGGGCFGDLNVTVWNTSVSLPLSSLCQYLAMLGNILVGVSMLMAARIVTRG